MEDREIVDLFLRRDEKALTESKTKYHRYLSYIASNVLSSPEDIEECENDVYFSAWTHIPPDEPENLKLYLAKIMRCRAIDSFRAKSAAKRGANAVISLDELMEAMPEQADPSAGSLVEEALDAKELGRVINDFLKGLPETDRAVFIRRYWFYDSIEEVAERFGFSVSKTKVRLFRIREKLRERLYREGYYL
ncbi:MAG: RNA polymerase sigma factor [Lachnospiraceae bacterium]|nr:RNA polymerase sigma factor [Lachnospiraceae bacterium]